jgi:hypothetical protein
MADLDALCEEPDHELIRGLFFRLARLRFKEWDFKEECVGEGGGGARSRHQQLRRGPRRAAPAPVHLFPAPQGRADLTRFLLRQGVQLRDPFGLDWGLGPGRTENFHELLRRWQYRGVPAAADDQEVGVSVLSLWRLCW